MTEETERTGGDPEAGSLSRDAGEAPGLPDAGTVADEIGWRGRMGERLFTLLAITGAFSGTADTTI